MNLDPNIIIATELDTLVDRMDSIVVNSLKEGFEKLSTAPDPQMVLDSFGDKAVVLFSRYVGFQQLLLQFGVNVPSPSGTFAPNPDGTVTYTPPEEEEGEDIEEEI